MKRSTVFVLSGVIIFVGWFLFSLFCSTGYEWWSMYYLEQDPCCSDVFIAKIKWTKVGVIALIVFLYSLILYFISKLIFPNKK
jgi:hypothetical protein